MSSYSSPSGFQLPQTAPEPIRHFHEIWFSKAGNRLPRYSDFDFSDLISEFEFLAYIAYDRHRKAFIWSDFAAPEKWPFGPPIRNKPIAEVIPPQSAKRVIAAFEEAVDCAQPDYREVIHWMYGKPSLSMVRFAAPLDSEAGGDLFVLWHVVEAAQSE